MVETCIHIWRLLGSDFIYSCTTNQIMQKYSSFESGRILQFEGRRLHSHMMRLFCPDDSVRLRKRLCESDTRS